MRFIYQRKNKHPEKKATHIDYGITIVMFPLVMTGTTIGVLVNLSFPPVILNALLAFVLLALGVQSVFLAKKRYDTETIKIQHDKEKQEEEQKRFIEKYGGDKLKQAQYIPSLMIIDKEPEVAKKRNLVEETESGVQTERIREILTEKEFNRLITMLKAEDSHVKQFPKILIAVISVILNLIVTLLRSNKVPGWEVKKCSGTDWTLLAFFAILMLIISTVGVFWNRSEVLLKMKAHKGLIASDIKYNQKDLWFLIIGGLGGGWVGGALGLGGGSIFNPLMTSMGLPPSVSTSTSSYMIMLSTGASCVMYTLYGTMNVDFGLWLSFWCSFGILIGIALLDWLITKFNGRQSLLLFCLVFMLILSALLIAVIAII